MERTERMVGILNEEWDNIIVLCSRYDGKQTEAFRYIKGNAFAIQQQIEDELDNFMFGGNDDGDDYSTGEEPEGHAEEG